MPVFGTYWSGLSDGFLSDAGKVGITDTNGGYTSTNVDGALDEIAADALAGRMWLSVEEGLRLSGASGRLGSRFPAVLLDASTSEQVNWSFRVPTSWSTMDVKILWGNASSGSGDVVWRCAYSLRDVGEDTSLGDVQTDTTTTAGAQDVIVSTTAHTGVDVSSKKFGHVRAVRFATDVADTLSNDVGLLGVLLERAS